MSESILASAAIAKQIRTRPSEIKAPFDLRMIMLSSSLAFRHIETGRG